MHRKNPMRNGWKGPDTVHTTYQPRVVGFLPLGPTGPAPFDAVRVRFPGLTDLLADDAGRGTPTPTVIVAPDRPGVSGAVERDGSFLTLVGAILDDTTPEELLSRWIERREEALSEVPFHGFLAAFHEPSNEAMLARDKYGVKIGYFALVPGGVVFSDDITALILCGANPSPHPEAFDAFLTSGYFPAPLTPYREASKLVPGHAVRIANGEVEASRPWASYRTLEPVAVDEATPAMRALLADAIGRLLPTDGEAALLLSGGIDSAMVAVGITRYIGASVRAYTFRYDQYEGDLNEGSAARATAELLGIPHEEIVVGPQNVIDDLDDAVGAYGEPFTWGIHSYRLEPIAATGTNAIFSGVGADGWGLSKRHAAAVRFERLPPVSRSALRGVVRALRPLGLSVQDKAEWTTQSVHGPAELFSPDSERRRALRRRVYRDPGLAERGHDRLIKAFDSAVPEFTGSIEHTLIHLDKRFTSAEAMLAWNRIWPRLHGLRACLPYYDHRLIDVAMNLEGNLTGKDILRTLASEHLPASAAQAPKVAQQLPIGQWLRGPLAEPARARLSELPTGMGDTFDPAGVLSILDDHISGKADHGWMIMALLTTAAWYRQSHA